MPGLPLVGPEPQIQSLCRQICDRFPVLADHCTQVDGISCSHTVGIRRQFHGIHRLPGHGRGHFLLPDQFQIIQASPTIRRTRQRYAHTILSRCFHNDRFFQRVPAAVAGQGGLGTGPGTAEKQGITVLALCAGTHRIGARLQRDGLADRHRRLVGAPPVEHGGIAAFRVLAVDGCLGFDFAVPVRGRTGPGAFPTPEVFFKAAILQQVDSALLRRGDRGQNRQHGERQQRTEDASDSIIFFHVFHLFIKQGAAARQSAGSSPPLGYIHSVQSAGLRREISPCPRRK